MVRTPSGTPAHSFSLTVQTNRTDLRTVQPVTKGLSFTNAGSLSGSTWNYYRIEVPTNATTLNLTVESTTVSPDLYIQRGQVPTTSSFLKRSTNLLNDIVLLADTEATAGAYYIGVIGSAGTNVNYTLKSEVLNVNTLNFDAGTTDDGIDKFSATNASATDTYFRIRTGSPAVGAWRTALKVLSGEAQLYLARGTVPSATFSDYKSERVGSDGVVLGGGQFNAGEDWYILVRSLGAAQWTLVSGGAYVMDLGELASDAGSSTNVVVGPEGWRFFKTSVPGDTLAWRLWSSTTNGLTATNQIYLRKSSIALTNSSELSGMGQLLVVPPYLAVGQLYFISVQDTPGAPVRLDSRQQQVNDISFTASTNVNFTGYGYTTYRVSVPANEIAWQITLVPASGNPNLYVRRNLIPNENYNDAYSEVSGSISDSISLVPPTLSDGTFYITVGASNVNSFTLVSGPPTVTDINYVDTVTNNETNRAGWRYYRVADINQQLGSLGWDLLLTNATAGTRIALRKSRAPSALTFRNPTPGVVNSYDVLSTDDFLQRPAHQADVWYIGIYNPTNALGNFTLITRELSAATLTETGIGGIEGSGTCLLSGTARTNVAPLKWEFFRVDVPLDVVGWDFRVINVSTGQPKVAIRLGGLPTNEIVNAIITTNIRTSIVGPPTATNWANGLQWAAGVDWTKRQFSSEGIDENGRIVAVGSGRPLVPGLSYYVGVFNTATIPASYEVVNRFIGPGHSIAVTDLAFNGGSATSVVCPRQARYYKVNIPANTPSWKVRLSVSEGEAMLVVSTNRIPNVESEKRVQKLGKEHYLLLPDKGQSHLRAGEHYLVVIGEGQNPASVTRIGSGQSTYVLESLGSLPIINMGTLVNELVVTNQIDGGESVAYQFNGIEDSLGFEATLEQELGNPIMVARGGSALPDPGVVGGIPRDPYGNEGGEIDFLAVSNHKIYAAGVTSTETIMVKARVLASAYPDARFVLRIKKFTATPLVFDGGTNVVVNQAENTWKFFEVDVPASPLGWDIRLTNVTAGLPQLVISRESVPVRLTTTPGFNPGASTNWPYFAAWGAGLDWTERSFSADGIFEYGHILAMGMNRPLEASKYYVGILSDLPASYTIVSRAIGITNASIPVKNLAFTNGSASGILPAREAAYFKVTVPTNVPSWKLRLTGASTNDEFALIALQGAIPSVLAGTGPMEASTNATSPGRKMQKLGEEHYLLLPVPGNTNLAAGDYYIAVASEGSAPANGSRVGDAPVNFTLTSYGVMPVIDLGTLDGSTDIIQPGQVLAGESIAYQFTVPAGTLSMDARLQNRVGNPVMVTRASPGLPDPGMASSGAAADPYGTDGGETVGSTGHATLITTANPVTGRHYVIVKARQLLNVHTNASFILRLSANNSTSVDFDGGNFSVTNQVAGTWRYYRIEVPTNALGWDIRLTNVTAGFPRMVLRRDVVPKALTTTPWASPGNTFSWSSTNQWAALSDWTKRANSPTGIDEEGRILAMGMGRPLEAGVYYVGVLNKTATTNLMSYTLSSRGIGTNLSIPVVDLPFAGGTATNLVLPGREAAYYRVVVPSNSPSWKVKVSGTAGEFVLLGMKDHVPNVSYHDPAFTISAGKRMQKSGNEHYVLIPTTGSTNILAGTYYLAVVGEGSNPINDTRIGAGSSSFSITSLGVLPVTDLGVVSATDLEIVDNLEGGEAKAYQFTVPVGSLGVEVKLDNRVGNPVLVLRPGMSLPNPGAAFGSTVIADAYGNDGGYVPTDAHPVLLTLPNPVPGTYSLLIKSREKDDIISDSSYRLRVREVLTPQLNFGPSENANGLTNSVSGTLEDNQRAFFVINVPSIVSNSPLGWKLELRQSSGLASVRVRRDALPSDIPATGTPFSIGAAYFVPPFLTNGIWYVEVKGANSTAFTLTSSPIELERPAWQMPSVSSTNTAPGLVVPQFGDTGTTTNGVSIGGDESLFLELGYQHYYSIFVPTNNGGLFRLQLEAISGNPDLYARMASAPTVSHNVNGATGTIIDRSMTAAVGTEYANWVPLSGKTETSLTPGHWYVMVRAASNANARYRLRTSIGNVQNINLYGESLSNQILASGDWRYYRFQVPTTVPVGWQVSFTQLSGDVWLYMRDTVPPGNGISLTDTYRHWNHIGDQKNNGPYPDYNNPGTYTFTTPPTRPGHVYYLGFRAIGDSTFSVSIGTNGVPLEVLPEIPFYGGSINTSIPGLSAVTYQIEAPADATRWKHLSTHTTNLLLYIEQGTLPMRATTDDWRSTGANSFDNRYLLNALPAAWPWVPAQTYYLTISNRVASPESLSFTMDGRNAATDDDDNDGIPDAWERQYFGSTSRLPTGDDDNDGVTNLLEYQDGTNPADNTSFRPRLTTIAVNGTITRDPNLASYPIGSTVTLTPIPSAAYAFVNWSNAVTGAANPLSLLMNGHKNVSAIFKVIGDDFSIAVPISGATVTTSGTNIGATKETAEPNHGSNPGGRSIWWKWVAPGSGLTTVDTASSSFNTLLGVYTGSSVGNLAVIASGSTIGTNKAKLTFTATSGTTYHIAVDGISAASGTINLGIKASAATIPLRIVAPTWNAGTFQFTLEGESNTVYTVYVSTNLLQWTSLKTVTNSPTGTSVVSDSTATTAPRYYRLGSQ